MKPSTTVKPSTTPKGRAWTSALGDATPTPTPKPSTPTAKPTPAAHAADARDDTGDPLTYTPDAATQAAFATFKCGDKQTDDPSKPLFSCDRNKQYKYLLGPAIMKGTDLADASAGIPQGGFQWQVNLKFTGEGGDKFLKATTNISAARPGPEPVRDRARRRDHLDPERATARSRAVRRRSPVPSPRPRPATWRTC